MSMNGEYINKMVDNMREATTEERQGISNYIDSIRVETGFNLWDLQEQVKIYDAYYNKGYTKGKEDAIDERASLLAFICKKYDIPLIDMNCTVDEWEELGGE